MLAGQAGASGTRGERVPAAEQRPRRVRDAVDGYRLGVAAITALLGTYLVVRLHALPPHEDETLVFFVTHMSFGDMLGTVLGERRGAPLHYLLAWLATFADPGLTSVRLVSVAFAVASMPLIAALVSRLSDRRTAVVATLLAATSWITLYHAIYARMYSLFLFTAVLSLLLLLRALERGSRRRWAAWAGGTLALIATQPYGALVLGGEIVYVAVLRLRGPLPLRRPVVTLAAVLVLATPLWWTYSLLASRFDVGLGENSSELGSPLDVIRYLGETFGDFTAGRLVAGIPAALLAVLGLVVLARRRPETALLAAAVAGVPVVALLAAGSGPGVSLESRHLIFLLPFVTMAIAAGILRIGEAARGAEPGVVAALIGFLLASQVAWGLDRTRWLYTGEPAARTQGREQAADWLAQRAQADDVLFGYEPTYLDAWEHGAPYGDIFIPRADARLALDELEGAGTPLGHGVWVLDASDYVDQEHARLTIEDATPGPEFETAVFGPFLLVRTVEPVLTPEAYLEATLRVQELSASLAVGDAGRNALTAQEALAELRGENP
jgi:Dolichyl-phosphate-mannose-protein mannosyltransferase